MRQGTEKIKISDYVQQLEQAPREQFKKYTEQVQKQVQKKVTSEVWLQHHDISILRAFFFFTFATNEVYGFKNTKKIFKKINQQKNIQILRSKFYHEQWLNPDLTKLAGQIFQHNNRINFNLQLLQSSKRAFQDSELLKKMQMPKTLLFQFANQTIHPSKQTESIVLLRQINKKGYLGILSFGQKQSYRLTQQQQKINPKSSQKYQSTLSQQQGTPLQSIQSQKKQNDQHKSSTRFPFFEIFVLFIILLVILSELTGIMDPIIQIYPSSLPLWNLCQLISRHIDDLSKLTK